MPNSNIFPMVMQLGFDPDTGTNPTLHLVPTIWIRCAEKRVVLPINSAPICRGQRFGYMTFESTGVIQADLEAYQLVEFSTTPPPGEPLARLYEVFGSKGERYVVDQFLSGVVPYA